MWFTGQAVFELKIVRFSVRSDWAGMRACQRNVAIEVLEIVERNESILH